MSVTSEYWNQYVFLQLVDVAHVPLLGHSAMRIWRLVIPKPEDRTPVTTHNAFNILFPLIPIFFMGYLVRRPNTYLYRLALMPFTIWTILRASFGYAWVNELHSPYNFGQGECLLRLIILSLLAY
jgi:hypothetical protein